MDVGEHVATSDRRHRSGSFCQGRAWGLLRSRLAIPVKLSNDAILLNAIRSRVVRLAFGKDEPSPLAPNRAMASPRAYGGR